MDASEAPELEPSRVIEEIRGALAQIGVDPAEVGPGTHLVDDLDLDSLDWVDLAMRLEDLFQVALREERFDSLRTVRDVAELVRAALSGARGAAA